jgi:hypothetical protein
MAIDYSIFAIPKPRPRALDKDAEDAKRDTLDKQESAKAKKRALGRCEVRTEWNYVNSNLESPVTRCTRQDAHTHHLKGGIGRRNHGVSIMAEQKLRVCHKCHADIHAKVLRPTTAEHDAKTVKFWRVK